MNQQFKDYFSFSKKERRGIFVFMCIIFLLIIYNLILPYVFVNDKVDFSEFEKEIKAYENEKKIYKDSKYNKNYSESYVNRKLNPFSFDPNNLPVDKWKALGFDDKQISIIKNYESKGGKFYKKEDFKKIYGITEKEYKVLEPYICIKKTKNKKSKKINIERKLKPFTFNPNNLPVDKWKALGFDDKQISIIKNYESKGGKFYKKEDFKKIYGITEKEYKVLEPYITIPENFSNNIKKNVISNDSSKQPVVEINSADTADLMKLRGIGSYFSKQIIKYRNLLGGFYKKEQLLEVYGMDSIRYYKFANSITVNKDSIRKININTVAFKKLLKHPYFEYYIVKSLFNYREKHGDYKSVAEIKNVKLIYDGLYKKVSPYLKVK